jgi:hypothetical protein
MIFNSQLVKQLRAVGCKFEDATKRVDIYRKKGSRDRVTFHRRDDYSDTAAISTLKQAGMEHSAAAEWVNRMSAENKTPTTAPKT